VLFVETYEFDDGHSDTLHWTIRKICAGNTAVSRTLWKASGWRAGWLRISLAIHARRTSIRCSSKKLNFDY
jgi:hypothetical protein